MRKLNMGKVTGLGLLLIGLALAVPAGAQMGGPQGQGMQNMSGMLHDMADQMMGMSGNLSQGKLSAVQQKQMAERMRTMATMMDNMSGMMGKGMMMDAGQQKQMGDMRMQMDNMVKEAPGGKKK